MTAHYVAIVAVLSLALSAPRDMSRAENDTERLGYLGRLALVVWLALLTW